MTDNYKQRQWHIAINMTISNYLQQQLVIMQGEKRTNSNKKGLWLIAQGYKWGYQSRDYST